MKQLFISQTLYDFASVGGGGWGEAEKGQKLTVESLAELESADNTVTEPPIHTPPWERVRGKKPVWWGHQPPQICQQRSWWAARGPLGFIRIISTSSKQWSCKGYCVGCLIVTTIVYLLPSFCNKICSLTMNDPCVRQQVPMAVTGFADVLIHSVAGSCYRSSITGTLPFIEKQVPVGGYSQEAWETDKYRHLGLIWIFWSTKSTQ